MCSSTVHQNDRSLPR